MIEDEIETPDWLEDDDESPGVEPANKGSRDIAVVSTRPTSVVCRVGDGMTFELMLVGWNSDGSPVVVGDDGALRLMDGTELIQEITW